MKLDKNHTPHHQQNAAPTAVLPAPPAPAAANPAPGNFVPSADEVARKAYFTYVNQGSQSGHEVQHWLQAESELIKERNLTRAHGYHNPT